MRISAEWLVARVLLLAMVVTAPAAAEQASIIIHSGRIWTGDPAWPFAQAIAILGNRVVELGDDEAILSHRGPDTRLIDASGKFVAPGFIDNHTHFDRAGALLLGINLLEVDDAPGLVSAVEAARDRLPAGAPIVGGDWGAYAQWRAGADGEAPTGRAPFAPDRSSIDALTPDQPVLLSRWDREQYLANAVALEAASLRCGDAGVTCVEGRTTGLLDATAASRVREHLPAKDHTQRLAEARMALARLRRHGVTGIHDITPPEQMAVFQALHQAGELTTRVYARPTLDRWQHLTAIGIRHGFGDAWLKIGGLKGFVDGIMGNATARFYAPYEHQPTSRGRWRAMMQPPGAMAEMLIGADAAGQWPQVHAIGDEAVDTLLDLYQQVIETNGPRPRRLRMIHAQVLRDAAVAKRMATLGVIAEVQPYHCIDDMRWMAERIGDRSRWAYAFRTLHEAGVRLSFGSDWPGTNASWYPANPWLGIYAAVTRQTLEGTPAAGWYPEERIDLHTALLAYTVHNAWAAGEEAEKGMLAPGMLADLVIVDRDPFQGPPAALKDVEVELTMVDGRVVYAKPRQP